jgi:hypothetical protein
MTKIGYILYKFRRDLNDGNLYRGYHFMGDLPFALRNAVIHQIATVRHPNGLELYTLTRNNIYSNTEE